MRIRDLQSDLDRCVEEIKNNNTLKQMVDEQNLQLQQTVDDQQQQLESLTKDLTNKDQLVAQKELEIKFLNENNNELKNENNNKTDTNFQLQLEVNRLMDSEKRSADSMKKLKVKTTMANIII